MQNENESGYDRDENESGYDRDVRVRKRRQRHSGRRDPHMFTVINRDEFEFWYGIHGPNGDHRRFVLPLDVAYVFFKRHVEKLERLYEKREREPPKVPLDDIDEYVSDAVCGLSGDGGERNE